MSCRSTIGAAERNQPSPIRFTFSLAALASAGDRAWARRRRSGCNPTGDAQPEMNPQMTLDHETRDAVIADWHAWRARELPYQRKATVADAIRFCGFLARKRSDLLNRCPPGDPWQHVKDCLLEPGLVVPMPLPVYAPAPSDR
jgi:hypothetical protein